MLAAETADKTDRSDFVGCEEFTLSVTMAPTTNQKTAARATVQLLVLLVCTAMATGCQTFGRPQRSLTQKVTLEANCPGDPARMPAKELAKITLPPYVIEPPDILLIDALRVVPKPPFRIQSFDTLQVIVEGTLLERSVPAIAQRELKDQ